MISVICPYHRAYEKDKLEKLYMSIINQSYKDFELLMVNDNSEVIEFEPHANVKYINIQDGNGNVSKARNIAMEQAKGEYVVFVDSDDILPENSFERRMGEADATHDLFIFSNYVLRNSKSYVPQLLIAGAGNKQYSKTADFFECITYFESGKKTGIEYVWDKMYKMNVIKENNIRFNENFTQYEDWLFNLDYFDHCSNGIKVSEKDVYNYYEYGRDRSKTVEDDLRQLILYFTELKERLIKHNVFSGDIKNGYYHGLINKIITKLILIKNQSEQRCKDVYSKLLEDNELKEGIKEYLPKNEVENSKMLCYLKENL